MKGIILHGGHGTRLRPLTHTGPKQLLPIANKPMSQYCIESMIASGVTEIAFIIGGIGANKVKEYYGEGDKFGVKFSYIEQDQPKGIAHAISLCKDFVNNEKFLVFLGDNILMDSITDYVEKFKISDADASIVLCEVENPSRFGIAVIENGEIKKIIEKPKNPSTNLAVIGVYLLTPKIFDIIDRLKPSWRNELEITDALQMLLEEKNKIIYNKVSENWKDTGTPEDIIQANDIILSGCQPYFLGEKDEDIEINGKIMVGKNSKIKKGAKLIGPVIIGENCLIESGIIGPNTSIGNNSRIAKCTISNSIIMEDCEIELKSSIENSIISKNSKILQKENFDTSNVFLLGEGTKIYL